MADAATVDMLEDVLDGLSRPQKELSPKYFYDHTGSELFERITALPEYYLSRAEEALLEERVPGWVQDLRPATLVELGAGSARKTRILLDAMIAVSGGGTFVPVDVSGDFLDVTVRQVRTEYPDLAVRACVQDIGEPLDLDPDLPEPVLFVLLGSTIGNFPDGEGIALLRRVRGVMGKGDRLLMGADLRPGGRKTVADIEDAYNDAAGVTAAFNRNVLRVLNDRLGADFEPRRFRHRAFYNRETHRVEMHLVSTADQTVKVGERRVQLAAGETIRTEVSCKYDRPAVAGMLERADLTLADWAKDGADRFAIAIAAPGISSAERQEFG